MTLASAIAAMSLRNLVHCALCLVVTFAGLACLFIQLRAEFVGFVQILVYVGAVSILVVFAILLTRGGGIGEKSAVGITGSWLMGILVSVLVFGGMIFSIISSSIITQPLPPDANLTVKKVGEQLMTKYVLPLEITGLLLTATMIGAVIIAMREPAGGAGKRAVMNASESNVEEKT